MKRRSRGGLLGIVLAVATVVLIGVAALASLAAYQAGLTTEVARRKNARSLAVS